jgi:Anti-sigma factor NepR
LSKNVPRDEELLCRGPVSPFNEHQFAEQRAFMTRVGHVVKPVGDTALQEIACMSNNDARPARKAIAVIKPTRPGDPIGDALKRLHDAVAEEPMPDSFLQLVAQIEAKMDRKDS